MLRYLYIKNIVRFCLTLLTKMGVFSANLFAMFERLGYFFLPQTNFFLEKVLPWKRPAPVTIIALPQLPSQGLK